MQSILDVRATEGVRGADPTARKTGHGRKCGHDRELAVAAAPGAGRGVSRVRQGAYEPMADVGQVGRVVSRCHVAGPSAVRAQWEAGWALMLTG
jgi:hypothetical protein